MAFTVRPEVTAIDTRAFLQEAQARYRSSSSDWTAPLRFGVDLGTATIVLTAVDAHDHPVYWDSTMCQAVRDGVVVDFAGAIREVRHLKERAQKLLGCDIAMATTAYPPGIAAPEARACRYVLEQSDIACRALIDEVSAAHALLAIEDGALVDVGGGSTGVGVFRGGRLIKLSDAAGGGHHLDLIVAGALKIPLEDAERRKRDGSSEIEQIVQPGIERIAESIKRQIGEEVVNTVYLVGGALMLRGAAETISRYLGKTVTSYPYADLITPYGMALSDG